MDSEIAPSVIAPANPVNAEWVFIHAFGWDEVSTTTR